MRVDRDQALLAALDTKRVSAKTIETVRDYLASDRQARDEKSNLDRWLELPDVSQRRLQHLLEDGLPARLEESAVLIELIESSRRDLETVLRSLAAAPKEESVRDVAAELKAATSELTSLQQQINRIDKESAGVQFERDELQKRVQKLRRRVIDEEIGSEEVARVAGLLKRTQETMSEFLRRATATKIDRLSQYVTDSFRFLLRKKSLIERVIIDPDSFSITLIDTAGNAFPKDRLSEGEKQIFAISVLWGLSRASARPLPRSSKRRSSLKPTS